MTIFFIDAGALGRLLVAEALTRSKRGKRAYSSSLKNTKLEINGIRCKPCDVLNSSRRRIVRYTIQ
ncbi:MAG: hypothetical protein CMF69_00650 [Magnetovibrio sp.]|nr:hypothetical protein [Magnetovibrio sp.]